MQFSPPKVDTDSTADLKIYPLLGQDKHQESAGSCIVHDLLPPELCDNAFEKLQSEVDWQRMHHQTGEVPRLVSCQGTIDADGSKPVYRHPSDQTLPLHSWTPTVDLARQRAETIVRHPLNHALIQLYRGGTDHISEHVDKTLDIVPDSFIVNVSFGAQRVMRLRTKRTTSGAPRTTHRVPMPHNSMLVMSLATNAEFLHGINADKRPQCELGEAETAFGGQRISLTFRHIGTFLDRESEFVWGQGATGKVNADARAVVHGDAAESGRLVKAFGMENQAGAVAWEDIYGRGSDVLHLK